MWCKIPSTCKVYLEESAVIKERFWMISRNGKLYWVELKNLSNSEWIIKPEIEDWDRKVTADQTGYIPPTSHSEAVGTAGLMAGYPYNKLYGAQLSGFHPSICLLLPFTACFDWTKDVSNVYQLVQALCAGKGTLSKTQLCKGSGILRVKLISVLTSILESFC